MNPIAWFLAIALPASGPRPILTDVLVAHIGEGATLAAQGNGDTVEVAARGVAQAWLRHGSSLSLLAEARTDSISVEFPVLGWGGWIPQGRAMFSLVQVASQPGVLSFEFRPVDLPPLGVGGGLAYARRLAIGGYGPVSAPVQSGTLACGDGEAYFAIGSTKVDSLRTPVGTTVLCDLWTWMRASPEAAADYANRATIAWPLEPAGGRWAIRSDSVNQPGLGRITDTIDAGTLEWIVGDTSGRWLAFDQGRATVYWRNQPRSSGGQIDSLAIGTTVGTHLKCHQVSQWKDLLLFAMDTELVFVRWNSRGVEVAAKYSLHGKTIRSASMNANTQAGARPVVWVSTGSELYSFRLQLVEDLPSPSRVRSSLRAGVSLTESSLLGGGTEIVIRGDPGSRVDISDLRGSRQWVASLGADGVGRWKATRPGRYAVRTSHGSDLVSVP